MKIWKEIQLITDSGELVPAIAPLIISASRSTDIPAFHSEWLINRINKGHACWVNRFNPTRPRYISFQETRLFIFWTKNPAPMLPSLHWFDKRGYNYYFQFTLNNYEKEGFEPNVPPLAERIKTFKQLSGLIGKQRVIWRFDPLILSSQLTVKELLTRIEELGNQLIKYTNKLVFSFGDILRYRNVSKNLMSETDFYTSSTIHLAEFTLAQKIEFAEGVQNYLQEWRKSNPDFQIATCAEEIDLDRYQITHNKCIDDDLIVKLFAKDKKLMEFFRLPSLTNQLFEPGIPVKRRYLKDKGQRKACCCIVSKDIGSYNTCEHLCVYCYANSSPQAVTKNLKKINPDSESIKGIRN